MEFFIGVDIGTTGIRSGVFDENFNLLGVGIGKSIVRKSENDEIYQDPEELLEETSIAVSESIRSSSVNPKMVKAISFDGQMAGIMGIDKTWNPVIPYDSWLDIRCSQEVDFMKKKAGRAVVKKTGIIPSFNHGPKILWWKRNAPEKYKKISKFIQPSVFIAGKLAGLKHEDAFIDWTYLHFTGFADNVNLKWDDLLTNTFGIEKEKLPKIVSPFTIIGHSNKEMSNKFGIKEGTLIAAGCGDTASSLLGSGVITPDSGADIAGTASVFVLSADKPIFDYTGTIYSARSVIKDLWYCMSYINGGGMNLEWFKNEFAQNRNFDDLNKEVNRIEPGSDGLIFIPHLDGRAYPPNSNLRGMWVGFRKKHTLYHFYRSILESVGYEYHIYLNRIRELYGDKDLEWVVRVIGGGSRGKVWNQIKADILGVKYRDIERDDVAILGQAFIAAIASGSKSNIKYIVSNVIKLGSMYLPKKEVSSRYELLFKRYKKLVENFPY